MKYITKLKLAASHQYCDAMDKSTEFTIEFLKDTVGVDYDCVMNYLMSPKSEHQRLRNELNDFLVFLNGTMLFGMECEQTMDKLEQIKNAVTANGMREWNRLQSRALDRSRCLLLGRDGKKKVQV